MSLKMAFRFARIAGLLLMIAARAFFDPICAFSEDWPRWGGVRGDNSWKAPKLPEKWPEKGLSRLWKQPIGGGYGGVSVADGRVYVMDHLKEPTEVERILCFDATTGKPLWKHEYPVKYGKLDYG